jgi:hypothetical protein
MLRYLTLLPDGQEIEYESGRPIGLLKTTGWAVPDRPNVNRAGMPVPPGTVVGGEAGFTAMVNVAEATAPLLADAT